MNKGREMIYFIQNVEFIPQLNSIFFPIFLIVSLINKTKEMISSIYSFIYPHLIQKSNKTLLFLFLFLSLIYQV